MLVINEPCHFFVLGECFFFYKQSFDFSAIRLLIKLVKMFSCLVLSLAYEVKGASVEEKGGEEEKQEAEEEPREIDGLKILTEANFETFLSQTEHVLVMFYAPC